MSISTARVSTWVQVQCSWFLVVRLGVFQSSKPDKVGNKYSIENLSQVEAELFFAQARKAASREEEEDILQRSETARSEPPSTVQPKGKKAKGKSIEPDTEAETTPASKKKKKSREK
jgi:hypothetical protein